MAKVDNILLKMLKLFDNELDKGKLFVSYPMVEALRHLKEDVDFKEIIAKSEAKYKKISKECDEYFLHFNDYIEETWNTLIDQHSSKANFIVNDKFEFPQNIIKQLDILLKQKEKYDYQNKEVGVVSAFPLFLVDYYGIKRFKE